MKWPLSDKPDLAAQAYQSGGAGIFAKPSEYVRIFSALLNGGVYAPTGARLLREETVKLMFENQIPQWPDFARQGIQTTQPLVSHTLPEIFPQEGNPPQGWGLSFFLTPTETPYGRGKIPPFGVALPTCTIGSMLKRVLLALWQHSCIRLLTRKCSSCGLMSR